MSQVNPWGQQAGNVAGNLANWNAQNPFQFQQNYALNQMAGGGFNADQLQAFQNQFNPNTGQPGGGQPQAGGGWPNLPTQPPPPPSPQVQIGMGNGAGGFPPNPGGGIPPTIGAPMAPGTQPQTGAGGQTQQPQQGGGAPGGTVGGQPSNPFGVGLNQAAGMGTTNQFTGTPTTAPTPQAPTTGAGGQFTNALLGGGFGADVGTAQQAQLSGLLNQAQGQGMSQAQQDQMFAAQYDPAAQAINESQNQALAQLSARGMGRSSAGVGNVEGERMQALGNVAQQAGANVTGNQLALQQQQAQYGLSGLGQFAGQGIDAALGMGNLGLGTEQLGTGNQLAMNQQQMQAQQQQFQQDNARAGLDLQRYQTEQGFNMQQYEADLSAAVASGRLDEQTAARMAQNAIQTTQQGLQAQQMQNMNNQALMNAALGAGGQALDYSGQNLQAQMGAGGMYGDLTGQFGNLGLGAQDIYQGSLDAQSQQRARERAARRQANAAMWGGIGQLGGAGIGAFGGGGGGGNSGGGFV
jgi:hypothetical protein